MSAQWKVASVVAWSMSWLVTLVDFCMTETEAGGYCELAVCCAGLTCVLLFFNGASSFAFAVDLQRFE
jgi:hypothetical protein